MKKEDLKKTRQYATLCRVSRAGVVVPLQWGARFDLSPTELLIYAYISHHTAKYVQKAYTGSIKGLCVITNTTLPTARRAVERLEEKGFIRKTFVSRDVSSGPGVDWVAYVATIPYDSDYNSGKIDKIIETNAAAYEATREYREEKKKKRGQQKKLSAEKNKNVALNASL